MNIFGVQDTILKNKVLHKPHRDKRIGYTFVETRRKYELPIKVTRVLKSIGLQEKVTIFLQWVKLKVIDSIFQ